MVDYGTQITNASNNVIIDSTYKNHIYHSHGTASVVRYLNVIDIADVSTSALLFIKAPSGIYANPYGFVKTGSVYDKIIIGADGTGTVDWVVYEECATDATGIGANVYTPSSEIAFSSNEAGYTNFINAATYGGNLQIGMDVTVRDTTNNYFTMTGGGYYYYYYGNLTPKQLYRQMAMMTKVSSTTINLKLRAYSYAEVNYGTSQMSGGGTFAPNILIEIKKPIGI
jgi:hypothetical protein